MLYFNERVDATTKQHDLMVVNLYKKGVVKRICLVPLVNLKAPKNTQYTKR
jgi:hypothetical protein